MPRNGSGVFTLAGADFPAVALTVIDPIKHNNNFNDVAAAMTSSIAVDGQSVITADIPMFGKKFTGVGEGSLRTHSASLGQVQDDRLNWVIAAGTADAITATFAPAITALVDGQTVRVRATAANTGAATFSPNGITARPITDFGGSPLTAGVIYAAGQELVMIYNSTALRWELANPALGSLVKVGTEALPAWPVTWRVVDLGVQSAFYAQPSGGVTGIAHNAYYDGLDWRARIIGAASRIEYLASGESQYLTSPSTTTAAGAILTFMLVSSTPAAPASGYVTVGAGQYLRNTAFTQTALVFDTLTAIPAPAGARGLILSLRVTSYTINAAGLRQVGANFYSDSAGTVVIGETRLLTREDPAAADGNILVRNTLQYNLPVIGGNVYIKFVSRAHTSDSVEYSIYGYTI